MRLQTITRVINALHSQQRLIVHLGCGHNLSITQAELTAMGYMEGLKFKADLEHADRWDCPYCPDAPKSTQPINKPSFQGWGEEKPTAGRPLPENPEEYSD